MSKFTNVVLVAAIGIPIWIAIKIAGFLFILCISGLIIWGVSWLSPTIASFFVDWIGWFVGILEPLKGE